MTSKKILWINPIPIFRVVILVLIFSVKLTAQECGNCKNIPQIATFDFDVQVPQPNTADSTEQLWPDWKNLFMFSGSVAVSLFNENKNCITFVQPPSYDKG